MRTQVGAFTARFSRLGGVRCDERGHGAAWGVAAGLGQCLGWVGASQRGVSNRGNEAQKIEIKRATCDFHNARRGVSILIFDSECVVLVGYGYGRF